MAHIQVPPDVPGIASLMIAYPETAGPLNELAQVLLRGPSTLSQGERELIAARVSAGNACVFCAGSHSAAATELLNGDRKLVDSVMADYTTAKVTPKMKALLAIADKVRKDGRTVLPADIERARKQAATDAEIHHTVLIAAAFSMYNRYVDGLGTLSPKDPAAYVETGKRLATAGYRNAIAARQAQASQVPAGAARRK